MGGGPQWGGLGKTIWGGWVIVCGGPQGGQVYTTLGYENIELPPIETTSHCTESVQYLTRF